MSFPDRPTIIVKVKGGRVSEILGTTTEIEAIVIDYDDLELDAQECSAEEKATSLHDAILYQLY